MRLSLPAGIGSGGEAGVSTEASITSFSRSVRTPSRCNRRSTFSSLTEPATSLITSLIFLIGVVVEVYLAVLWNVLLQEFRHCAVAFHKDVDEVLAEILVTLVVERRGQTLMSDTGSTTNTMDVLLDTTIHLGWKVVVNYVLDVLDVPTASGDSRGDKDGCAADAEGTPCTG